MANLKQIVLILLLVLLPLALIGFVAFRLDQATAHDQARSRLRAGTELADRVESDVASFVDGRTRRLESLLRVLPSDPEAIRHQVDTEPDIGQVFVLDDAGNRIHPPPRGATQRETDFLVRSAPLWSSGERFYEQSGDEESDAPLPSGWATWFFGNGAQFLYWLRLSDGRIVGAEVTRADLVSDLIAQLPDRYLHPLQITDASDRPLLRMGPFNPEAETPPLRRALPTPLDMWQLTVQPQITATAAGLSLMKLFPFIALGLIGFGVYLYRETTRDMREAYQKVSFVNQVSHELKTPLTNIRMYAELMENTLDEQDAQARSHLGVVVSESQRLSRLINNVLTFSRRGREGLKLQKEPGVVDAVIREVLENFQPALASKHIVPDFQAGAPARVMLDADLLAQVIGNLLGNVEKYAAGGGKVELSTHQDEATTTVKVRDFGPGIPVGQRKQVFEPFCRGSDRTSDGVAGTGIGLTIVRDLVRLHGGDIRLDCDGESGCCFTFTFSTPESNA